MARLKNARKIHIQIRMTQMAKMPPISSEIAEKTESFPYINIVLFGTYFSHIFAPHHKLYFHLLDVLIIYIHTFKQMLTSLD